MTGSIVLWLLVSAVTALAVAGLLAAGETAISLVSRARAEALHEEEPTSATRRLLAIMHDVPRTLAAAVFTRITLEMLAAVIFTIVYAQYVAVWWQVGLYSVITSAIASFLLTGVSPRTVGRRTPERTALQASAVLRAVYLAFGWVARLLVHIGSAFTPGGAVGGGPFATELALRNIVEIATENDALEDDEAEMIQSVVEFGRTPVRQVMVDRTRMVAIKSDATLLQAVRLFNRSGHSRLPVIGEDVDDLLGLLYLKDTLRALYSDTPAAPDSSVLDIMREPSFVPDSSVIDTVLLNMRTSSVHVVIVVDEYGGIAGMATIEDLIEEIIGEISDEHDRDADDLTVEVEPGIWEVPAHLNVSDAGDLLDLEVEDEDVDSIGGLLGKAIGLVPVPGSAAEVHGIKIVALETAGRRKTLHRVRLSRAKKIADGDHDVADSTPPAASRDTGEPVDSQ